MTTNNNPIEQSPTHKLDMATKPSERDARIIKLRKANLTYAEIADDIPCANQTVYHVLFKAGLTSKGRKQKLTDANKEEIVRLRTQDPSEWTYMALATKFDTQSPTINKILRAAGLTRPKKQA